MAETAQKQLQKEKTNKSLNTKVTQSLNNEKTELKQKVSQLEQIVANYQNQDKISQNEIAMMMTKITELETASESHTIEREESAKLKELEKEAAEQIKQLEEDKLNVVQFQQEEANIKESELQQQIDQLTQTLNSKDSQIAELATQKDQQTKKI